jgi:hypothetical protein
MLKVVIQAGKTVDYVPELEILHQESIRIDALIYLLVHIYAFVMLENIHNLAMELVLIAVLENIQILEIQLVQIVVLGKLPQLLEVPHAMIVRVENIQIHKGQLV